MDFESFWFVLDLDIARNALPGGHEVSMKLGMFLSRQRGALFSGLKASLSSTFLLLFVVEMKALFRKKLICKYGDPYNMLLINVESDSMEDTLSSDDTIPVDHSKNYILP